MKISQVIAFYACALSAGAADYATYIGDVYKYQVTALAADAQGNTYVTGSRAVTVPPSVGSVGALNDIFVSKLNQSGNLTLLATLSGKGSDQANGIALDSSGNIYIVGSTSSPDFPLHHPLQSSGSGSTGFLAKLSPDGVILYSTYLGGTTGSSTMNAVAVDAQGNAYVTGQTSASDYPRTPGLPNGSAVQFPLVSAAFFAKISPAGDKILYAGGLSATTRLCTGGSSCFLSPLSTSGSSIAVDAAGNAYIAGNSNGAGLPTKPGVLQPNGAGAFVAKVNSAGTDMVYVTWLGATTYGLGFLITANTVNAITADAAGNAYIAGSTSDPSFPVTPSAFQTSLTVPNPVRPPMAPPADAFVAKLNPNGSAMVWATFLGGTAADLANSISVDLSGNVWVSGITRSSDFPVSSGFPGGPEFLAEFNTAGSALAFGLRAPADSAARALAVDPNGVVHFAGSTGLVSTITPSQAAEPRIFGLANAAGGQLAGRLAPAEVISIYGLHLGPSAPAAATFDSNGFLPTTLAGVQVTINGIAAPLLYVSDTQINAVAPIEIMNGAAVPLQVTFNITALPGLRVAVDANDPEVFLRADGTTAAVNQDGTLNSQSNPAHSASFVSIWATGAGGTYGLSDGQLQTAAQDGCGCALTPLGGNQLVIPSYAGAAPGMVNGLVQINFQIPTVGGAGPLQYFLLVNGKSSGSFTIYAAP